MTDIKEKLAEAKNELLKYEEKVKQLTELKNKINEKEKALKDIDNKKHKAIESTMKEKKKELDEQYNAIVVDLTKKINAAKEKKKAEIKKNKQEKIEKQTKEKKENIELLKNKIKDLLKTNGINSIAGTDFYFTYFRIVSIKGVIKAIVTYVILFLLIPLIVSNCLLLNAQMFQGKEMALRVAVFVINFFVWGVIWLIISHITEMPLDVYLTLKNLKLNIYDNKEQIKIITDTIMRDTDESQYDYTEIDREIEQANLDLNKVKEQNEKDVIYLNTIIHDEVVAKIEEEVKKENESLKTIYDSEKAKSQVMSEELENMKYELEQKYVSLVGKENMSSDKIEKLISILNNNNEQDLLLEHAKELAKKK